MKTVGQYDVEYTCVYQSARLWPHLHTVGVYPLCNTTFNSSIRPTIAANPRWHYISPWSYTYLNKKKLSVSKKKQIGRCTRTTRQLGASTKNSVDNGSFDSVAYKNKKCNPFSLICILRDPFTSIDDMYARMVCLDRYFLSNQDNMLHFNNIYLQMTRLVREKIATGAYFTLSEWMKNYTTHFGNFYRKALLSFSAGDLSNVPACWRLALQHARKGDQTIFMNFALGMSAHIVRDLGIALSELGIADKDTLIKRSDSDKVNAIIHNCSLELLTSLIKFYAPVINMTNWNTLIHVGLDTMTDTLRFIAWNDAMFLLNHPTHRKTVIHSMDIDAQLLEEALLTIAPLFKELKNYERLFSFGQYCSIVPWGCGETNK